MADDVIDKIKERVDIVDLISGYIKLQKSGVNFKARCPFHNEKTGSFFVSPERQIWHCFGCNLGGDIFGFVKQIEGVEFPDALRTLAAKAGVELKAQSPEVRQFQNAKAKLYEITELAVKYFEKQLWQSAVGRPALEYLRRRGLTDESIKNFRLGFAPDSWNALADFITTKYSPPEVAAAGLIIKSDKQEYRDQDRDNRYYDRFRSRIMFPIFDANGQAVGFSGRIFESNAQKLGTHGTEPENAPAKYVNTPQTPIYDKSRVLYGLEKAKLDIRRANRCLVVEGNMDVIMSHQAGAANAVASSGTALTEGHLKIIRRYTDNLDLCFDADNAGENATDRGVELALANGFNVGLVAINEPGVKDPADYVVKHGAAWVDLAGKSRPFLEVFFENAKKKYDITTALGKKLLTQKLLPIVAVLANKIEQAHWLGEIAMALRIKEEVLSAELALIKTNPGQSETTKIFPARSPGASDTKDTSERLNVLEESLLSLVLKKPELALELKPEQEIFLSENCRRLVKQAGDDQLIPPAQTAVKMSLDIAYLKSQELWKDFEDAQMEREFANLLVQAKKHYISAQLQKLEFDIKTAEKAKDKPKLALLMAEFSQISKELGN